jgi:DNA mismatch repair ATPase MutS
MVLLTGPNMAGKSTVLRTVAACSLLGAAGLMAPCEDASIPYLDAFILRTFSQDRSV